MGNRKRKNFKKMYRNKVTKDPVISTFPNAPLKEGYHSQLCT